MDSSLGASKMHETPTSGGVGCCPFLGGGSVFVDLLFYLPPFFVGVLLWSLFWYAYFMSFLVLQSSWRGREIAGYLALIVLHMSW